MNIGEVLARSVMGRDFVEPEPTAKPVPELVRWRKDKRRPKSGRLYKAKIVRRR